MSHEIETALFATKEGVGWHGIGLAIPENIAKDPKKIAKLLKADWTVKSRPAFYKTEGGKFAPATGFAAQVRSDTGDVLSLTSSDRYHVQNRQPVDVLEAFRDDLAKENLTISHAAVLRGGRIIAVSALLAPDFHVRVGKSDTIKTYATLSTGYDKQHGTKASITGTRVVCMNTLEMSLSEARRSGKLAVIRASTKMEEYALKDLLQNAYTVTRAEKSRYDAMLNKKLTDVEVQRYFADVLEINIADLGKTDRQGHALISTKSENMLKALTEAYKNAPGAKSASGTAWGALNAVTYYATHEKTIRDTNEDGAQAARVASNMFGDAARLKARALSIAGQRIAA